MSDSFETINVGVNLLSWLNVEMLNVFGLTFTLLVVIYIIVSTFVLIIPFLRAKTQLKNTTQELSSFLELLRGSRRDQSGMDAIPMRERVHDFIKRDGIATETHRQLEHAWQEFDEGILQRSQGEWMNVYQAEDFFKPPVFIQPVVKPIHACSSLATSSGLLVTFIALTAGLSELYYDLGTKLIDGLDIFINALSAKFLSSIIGLLLGIVFDAVAKKGEKKLEALVNDISYELNHEFKRLTSQHVLLDIQKDVHYLPQNIGDFLSKNEGQASLLGKIESIIKESMTTGIESINTEIQTVSKAMEGFSSKGMENVATTLEELGNKMGESLTQGMNKDMQSLQEVMRELPEVIGKSMGNVETSIGAMKIAMQDTQKSMLAEVQELFKGIHASQGKNMDDLIKTFMDKNAALNDQMVQQQNDVTRKHQESMGVLTAMLDQMNQGQDSVKTNLQETLTTQLETMASSFADIVNEMKVATQSQNTSMNEMLGEILTSMQVTLAESGNSMNAKVLENQSLMQSGIEGMLGKVNRETTSVTQELSNASRRQQEEGSASMEKLNTSVNENIQTLVDAQTRFSDSYDLAHQAFIQRAEANYTSFQTLTTNTLTQHEKSLHPVLNELRTSVQTFRAVADKFPAVFTSGSTQLEKAFGTLKYMLDNEFKHFVESQKSLTKDQQKVLSATSDAMKEMASLQRESSKITEVIESLSAMQAAFAKQQTDHSSLGKEQLDSMRYALEQQKDTMASIVDSTSTLSKRYEGLDILSLKISEQFGDAGERMADSIVTVKDASEDYFSHFVKHHREAIGQLQRFIEDMDITLSPKQLETTVE